MDIRKLLKATCPLIQRHGLSNSIFRSTTSFQSRSTNHGYNKFRRNTTNSQYHTFDSCKGQYCQSGLCAQNYQNRQVRHRSTFYSSEHRAGRRLLDRSQASSFHSRSYPPNHHRTQKPSLLNWRNRQNTKSPLSSLSANSYGSKAVETILPDLAPFPAASLRKAMRSTFYSNRNSLKRIPGTRLGKKRRRRAAMHRSRLQRRLRGQRFSVPRLASQLFGLRGISNRSSRQGNRHRNRMRHIKWRRDILRQRIMDSDEPLRRQHLHIHYYSKSPKLFRRRFLGFQHFLRHTRINSSRGQQAHTKAEEALRQRLITRNRNQKYSRTRPYVQLWREELERLGGYLETGNSQKAIRSANFIFKARGGGAKMPGGTQLWELMTMDEIHYSTSLAAPVEEETKDFLEKPKLARFTVKDINTILEWCHSKRDLRTGLSISRILLSRYESSSFNFESEISAPNTRTISLLLMTFASNNHTEGAKRLLACIHDRYSHPIPIDVYVRFLEKLAAKPNQMELMESTLSHLQEHGPAPTVEIYNTFLKSYALHSGSKQAGDFLKNMLGHNHSANRQSFRILIESSLKELRMNRAHYWLAEYSRQGYQITPKMMESFMKTCIQQFVKSRGSKATLKSIVETKAYTNEWMHKALYLIQFMSNQRIQPTATTFELLIEGFLSQGRLLDATKILRRMRDSPHLYTPAAKTWKLFFDYYLTENDHISALKAINDMRHSLSQQPFKSPGAVVPVELYHELFRHVLEHGQLSFAESSLYEMMLNQNRKQPTEKEVVDLIWQLDHNPEAAERVYELLYSQTPDPNISTYKFDEELRHIRRNRILEQGPIQMANVGLMRARANSNKDNLLHEVWKAWNEMTEVFTQNQWQRQLSGDPIDTKAMEKEMSVLASAFEQVAKACRAPKPVKRKRQAEEQEAESATVESGWDFGRVRRAISPTSYGLGLGFGPNGEASSVTSNLSAKGMDRVLIKRLLQRKEVAKPLLDRHDSLIESGTSLSKLTENVEDSSLNYTNDVRLENLKSSFDWVQRYKIPICIEGLNTYISSVLSHNDFDEVKSCLERSILMPSSSSDSSVPTDIPEDAAKSDKPLTKSLSQPLSPDIATIQILYGRMARIPEELMHLSLYRGGQNLIKEWIDRLETIRNWDTSDVD